MGVTRLDSSAGWFGHHCWRSHRIVGRRRDRISHRNGSVCCGRHLREKHSAVDNGHTSAVGNGWGNDGLWPRYVYAGYSATNRDRRVIHHSRFGIVSPEQAVAARLRTYRHRVFTNVTLHGQPWFLGRLALGRFALESAEQLEIPQRSRYSRLDIHNWVGRWAHRCWRLGSTRTDVGSSICCRYWVPFTFIPSTSNVWAQVPDPSS